MAVQSVCVYRRAVCVFWCRTTHGQLHPSHTALTSHGSPTLPLNTARRKHVRGEGLAYCASGRERYRAEEFPSRYDKRCIVSQCVVAVHRDRLCGIRGMVGDSPFERPQAIFYPTAECRGHNVASQPFFRDILRVSPGIFTLASRS